MVRDRRVGTGVFQCTDFPGNNKANKINKYIIFSSSMRVFSGIQYLPLKGFPATRMSGVMASVPPWKVTGVLVRALQKNNLRESFVTRNWLTRL